MFRVSGSTETLYCLLRNHSGNRGIIILYFVGVFFSKVVVCSIACGRGLGLSCPNMAICEENTASRLRQSLTATYVDQQTPKRSHKGLWRGPFRVGRTAFDIWWFPKLRYPVGVLVIKGYFLGVLIIREFRKPHVARRTGPP